MRTSLREGLPSPAVPMLVIGIAAALAPLGCNLFNQGESCSPTCRSTFSCDRSTGVCRPESLETSGAAPPAHHLATTTVDGHVFAAAIAPARGLVVAGRPGEPDGYAILDRLEHTDRSSTAVAAGTDGVHVVWLTDDQTYRLASRREGRWNVVDIAPADEYRGSRHFDLVAAEAGLRLVFRDRRGNGLRALIEGTGQAWVLQSIDDGTTVRNRSQCPSDVGDPKRSGVGYEPDAEWIDGTVFVSYYDADCGDLRLARRNDDAWSVNIIDTGDFAVDVAEGVRQSGDVGRHSALAADTNGNIGIAYQDVGRGRLLFARETSSGFDVELVDPGIELDAFSQKRKQLVGAFADLTFQRIDNTDVPYIAYMNGSETQIQLAYRARGNATQWLHRTLAPEPPTGFFTAIESTSASGLVILAERLAPSEDGVASRLVRRRQEVP